MRAWGHTGNSALAWVVMLALGFGGLGACAPQSKTGQKSVTDGASVAQTTDSAAQSGDADASSRYKQAMEILEKDPAQATVLLESAALEGHGDAAYQLGLAQSDPNRRLEWHSMAASMGQIDAQYALGEAYLTGQGTAKEPAWGLSWFERAARAGQAQAQYAMGMALVTGLVGPPQREEGLVWLMIAGKNGVAQAALATDLLKARMSTAVLNSVTERVDAWTNEPAGDAEARATVRFAQHALGRLGFDAGLPDGIRGDRTDQAVTQFRMAEELGAGDLDIRTLDLLRERVAVLNR